MWWGGTRTHLAHRVGEHVDERVLHAAQEGERRLVVSLRLAAEAADEVGRERDACRWID